MGVSVLSVHQNHSDGVKTQQGSSGNVALSGVTLNHLVAPQRQFLAYSSKQRAKLVVFRVFFFKTCEAAPVHSGKTNKTGPLTHSLLFVCLVPTLTEEAKTKQDLGEAPD